jgi:hypothetical protein
VRKLGNKNERFLHMTRMGGAGYKGLEFCTNTIGIFRPA